MGLEVRLSCALEGAKLEVWLWLLTDVRRIKARLEAWLVSSLGEVLTNEELKRSDDAGADEEREREPRLSEADEEMLEDFCPDREDDWLGLGVS